MNQINPQPTLIPTFSGNNFAPLKPILKAQDTGKQANNKLADAFRERYNHYNSDNKPAWGEILKAGQLVSDFDSGKQLVVANPFTGGTLLIRPQREDESTKRALNQMQFYRTKIEQMWMGSKPDITVEPGRRTDAAMMAARGAAAVVDYYETKLYDDWWELAEAGLARCFGTYINQYHWDTGVSGLMTIREIVENKTLKFNGFGYCGDCNKYGDADEFKPIESHDDMQPQMGRYTPPVCPQCGSMSVHVQPGTSRDVSSVVDKQRVNLGDLVCRQRPLTGCRWNLYKRPEQSSWFIYKEQVSVGAIRALVGQIRLPNGDNQSDTGLNIEKLLAYGGQAVGGRSGTSMNGREQAVQTASLEQFWMSAEDLTEIVLEGGEETVSGQTLPAGRLSDLCPDGCVAVGVNGMSLILGIYQESHRDKIVSGVYHSKTLSGAGRGDVDSVEVQRRMNTLDSQQLVYMNSSATPAYIYRPEAIASEEVGYLGHPATNIPLRDLPQGMTLAEVAQPLPPGRMDGAIINYTQQFLRDQAQMASHCVEFSGAIPGVDNKTAHGAELARSLAQSLFAPMLMIKAYTRKRGAEIIIDLYRKHMPVKQHFPLAGRRNGSDGIYLSGADLCIDLVFDVVTDSWVPKSTLTKREDMNAIGAFFGGGVGYIEAKTQAPKQVSEIEKIYGVETDLDDFDAITTLCRKRLTQMQEAEKLGPQDPMQLVSKIDPAIDPLEPQQQEYSEWWRQFLTTDDGQTASPMLRQACAALVAIHAKNEMDFQSIVAEMAGQVQMAGQQPQMEAQAQQQMAQAQQQAQIQQEQSAQEAANQPSPEDPQAQAAMQDQLAEAQHGREVEKMLIKHANDAELKGADLAMKEQQMKQQAKQKGAR